MDPHNSEDDFKAMMDLIDISFRQSHKSRWWSRRRRCRLSSYRQLFVAPKYFIVLFILCAAYQSNMPSDGRERGYRNDSEGIYMIWLQRMTLSGRLCGRMQVSAAFQGAMLVLVHNLCGNNYVISVLWWR